MERSQILETMSGLKLFGMKAAYDEIIATAVKRQHEPQRIVGDLLAAEIAEKQARSIKYQMTTARLPLAKDLGDFTFGGTPINATLVHDLAGADSSPTSATSSWSAELVPARPISPSPSRGPASATAPAAASSTSSTWSTSSRPRAVPAARAGWPTISHGWTLSSSTSSAICRSPNLAASSYST
jgi:hypothetical protein